MPRREDLKRILVIGAGPIVIGQACEFDYSGTQACKALRSEGLDVILINSNPATIMTDPEMADRTYIEPLTVEAVTKVIEKERPDAILPTVGGQTALNLAVALHDAGVLDQVRREADRRERRRHQAWRRSPALPRRDERDRRRDARQRPCAIDRRGDSHRQDDGIPGHHPAVLHDGRRRRRHRLQHRRVPRARRSRPRDEPCSRAPHRRVRHRLERVRARGDARRRRQLRRHLLDREHRSDGRAHRRQHHRRARADADRQGISAHARRRAAHHQQGRRRNRRIEHPVLRESRRRAHARHRDEPARVAVIRAGVEGHRVSRSRRSPPSSRSAITSTRFPTTSRG